jgi:uncharacterized protein YndB with AHSA1/START domain
MDQAPTMEANAEGLTITRIFNAPPDAVFRAWIEPEPFAVWWGGRAVEVPLSSVSMDPRPGGTWRATMQLPDGNVINWYGEYREVEPPERLVFTVADRPGDERELVTVTLRDLGDGRTEMRLWQTGGHMDAEGYTQAGSGWQGFFDTLAEELDAAA